MSSQQRYCFIEPKFPQKAYVLILFIFRDGSPVGILPLYSVRDSIEEAAKAGREAMTLSEKSETVRFQADGILIPITFVSRYPLKKAFWQKPSFHYAYPDRAQSFIPVIKKPQLYHLLVTPAHVSPKEETLLEAALPLLDPNDTKVIEQFMYGSDLAVHQVAKYAAIYHFEAPLRFNMVTGETSESDPYVEEEKN